jgi:RNA polymerase sigma-70 factor (ECF subfamily)
MADADLTALAFAAGRGDRAAAADLIRATQSDVLRFLRPLTDAADVEDLAQETYLRAFRALPDFAGRSSVRTWLIAIARRVAADQVRHASRRPRVAAVTDWLASAESADSHSRSRFEEHHAVVDLLSSLTAERREAFVATQVLGMSYAEAAEVCDCPVGTIRSRVARAREDLMAALRDRPAGRRPAAG